MHRRQFLNYGLSAATSGCSLALLPTVLRGQSPLAATVEEASFASPTFSVIPVVGDGKWIWNKPPDGQTGYLEPRQFDLSIGIELHGQGNATQLKATTPVPSQCPEQKIDSEKVETKDCEAEVRDVAPYARQLVLAAGEIVAGQVISAVVHFKLTLFKQYLDYERDQFPQKQTIPSDVRHDYLGDSPGIQTRTPQVQKLLAKLKSSQDHPWDLARKIADWIRHNVRPQIQPFSGVTAALDNLRGDCAEMSAIFVALCRAAEIPARLVWVPNHNWAEFCLVDDKGKEQWIPAHTACYFWFGWTGVHELVIQKGDRIRVPEKLVNYRLLEDWMQWKGRRPEVKYTAELTPLPAETGGDPGPGARRKVASGEWQPIGKYAGDRYVRR